MLRDGNKETQVQKRVAYILDLRSNDFTGCHYYWLYSCLRNTLDMGRLLGL
jgi:hypothetical protein